MPLTRYKALAEKAEASEVERYTEIMAFRDLVADISPIEAILVSRFQGGYSIWTVIDEPSAAIRAKIYEREWQLMERYPQTGFSFHILEREGEELNNLVSLDRFDLNLLLRER